MNKAAQALINFVLIILFTGVSQAQQELIYTQKEVDVKAVIKKTPNPNAVYGWNCPAEGEVILKVTLHVSGKVTNVELEKGLSCGYDEKAIGAAKKIKFIPAVKNGRPVSQYAEVVYSYNTKLK